MDYVQQLRTLEQAQLLRTPPTVDWRDGVYCGVGGQRYLTFCSNDYLGLSQHPKVVEAATKAMGEFGLGSTASHMVVGHSRYHHELEAHMVEHMPWSGGVLMASGYVANLAIIQALCGRHHTVFQDRLNHASLLDAARLSGAKLVRYAHNDVGDLRARVPDSHQPSVIVSDGVFSMDGDVADVVGLAEVAQSIRAPLVIDDAHGFGVLGANGEGSVVAQHIPPAQVEFNVCTFGKAMGTMGAVVMGDRDAVEWLKQKARPYIYSTAMPPSIAAASLAAFEVMIDEPERRQQLASRIAQFRAGAKALGLELLPSQTAIQPIVLGSAERALAWSDHLKSSGVLVSAIRPPTVPTGAARLRITLSAEHTTDEAKRAEALEQGEHSDEALS